MSDLVFDRDASIEDIVEKLASTYDENGDSADIPDLSTESTSECQTNVINSMAIYFPNLISRLREEKTYDYVFTEWK